MTESVQKLGLGKTEVEKKEKEKSGLVGWLVFIVLVVSVLLTFRYVIGITFINGHSMSPTLEDGDVIITSNMLYTPERNDIVIFRDEAGYDVIKRIIALPGETIAIKDGTVLVNGVPVENNFAAGIPDDMSKKVVADGSYFLIGDNRVPGKSLDSRSSEIGTIPRDEIKAEVLLSLYPFGLMKYGS